MKNQAEGDCNQESMHAEICIDASTDLDAEDASEHRSPLLPR